jgi:hypothetical protein
MMNNNAHMEGLTNDREWKTDTTTLDPPLSLQMQDSGVIFILSCSFSFSFSLLATPLGATAHRVLMYLVLFST